MGNWQWRWVLATEDDVDYLRKFGDQWQFALARHSLLSPASAAKNMSTTRAAHALAGALQTPRHRDLYLYSLLPQHGHGTGLRRAPNLKARINPEGDTLFMGRLMHRLSAHEDVLFDRLGKVLKEQLFPSVIVTYKNFMGRTLVATANEEPPFFEFADTSCKYDPSKACVPKSGIDLSLLQTLAASLNFRWEC
jgi:hypothetical protein